MMLQCQCTPSPHSCPILDPTDHGHDCRFVNRKYMVEFLYGRVFSANHSNVLEDFLYVSHCSVEYIAMMRANAILFIIAIACSCTT